MTDMANILRDESSGICMTGGYTSTGSQISVIPTGASQAVHWFTATPNPKLSIYKPFIFCTGVDIGDLTVSPKYGAEDPINMKPRFTKEVDRRHKLYKAHGCFVTSRKSSVAGKLKDLEKKFIQDVTEIKENYNEEKKEKASEIFKNMCTHELDFYREIG